MYVHCGRQKCSLMVKKGQKRTANWTISSVKSPLDGSGKGNYAEKTEKELFRRPKHRLNKLTAATLNWDSAPTIWMWRRHRGPFDSAWRCLNCLVLNFFKFSEKLNWVHVTFYSTLSNHIKRSHLARHSAYLSTWKLVWEVFSLGCFDCYWFVFLCVCQCVLMHVHMCFLSVDIL